MTDCIHVLGGDARSYYTAKYLLDFGYSKVLLSGFDNFLNCSRDIDKISIKKPSIVCETMVLPIPYKLQDGNLKLTYCDEKVNLNEVLDTFNPKKVFLGVCDTAARNEFEHRNIKYFDFLDDEDFVYKNAYLTAQAAILNVFEKSDFSPKDAKILILGTGRIGKKLSFLLKKMDADVCASARKQADFDYLSEMGIKSVETANIIETINEYDIVINTIPQKILSEKEIRRMKKSSMAVDLASYPYGIDFEACAKHSVRSYLELGLPGRYFPESAGKLMSEYVLLRTVIK